MPLLGAQRRRLAGAQRAQCSADPLTAPLLLKLKSISVGFSRDHPPSEQRPQKTQTRNYCTLPHIQVVRDGEAPCCPRFGVAAVRVTAAMLDAACDAASWHLCKPARRAVVWGAHHVFATYYLIPSDSCYLPSYPGWVRGCSRRGC